MSKRSFSALPAPNSCAAYTTQLALIENDSEDRARSKKKKSRWSVNDDEKTFVPGMPTQLPPNLTPDQEKIYILQIQIEDLTRRLKSGDLGIPKNPDNRSPSPEPIYSNDGKRLNTREYRTRKRMEDDRHALIRKLVELKPEYQPPVDYKAPQNRMTDKVWIPQEDNPHINFVGLLIGPRGNTLKALEKDTGAKVIIRGKGSVKDGKVGRRDGLPMPGEDEPLHAYVTAPTAEAVSKAVRKIREIIRQGIEVPESQNDLRRQQLRDLALLNGTLRENEGLMKLRAMAEAKNIATNQIQCTLCGGFGHIASDCKFDPTTQPSMMNSNPLERAKMDSEYSALMAELGCGGIKIQKPPGVLANNTGGSNRYSAPKQPPPPGVTAQPDDDEDDQPASGENGGVSHPTGYPYSLPSMSTGLPLALPPPPPPPMSSTAWPPAYPPAVGSFMPPPHAMQPQAPVAGMTAYGLPPPMGAPGNSGAPHWQRPPPNPSPTAAISNSGWTTHGGAGILPSPPRHPGALPPVSSADVMQSWNRDWSSGAYNAPNMAGGDYYGGYAAVPPPPPPPGL